MSRKSKTLRPALVSWDALPARARALREKHERGDRLCDVIYIFDPAAVAAKVTAIPKGADVAGDYAGQVCNAFSWLARIYVQYPRDGAGTLRVLVMCDRGPSESIGYYYGEAQGYGYDKLTAALDGCPIPGAPSEDGEGITLGDHCDHMGDPTLRDLRGRGLVVLGY